MPLPFSPSTGWWDPVAALTVAGSALAVLLALLGVLLWHLVRTRRSLLRARAEAERLRDLAKDRATRVATLSHEVRTPLALIHGAGELLADGSAGPVTDQQERFIRTITSNCSHVIEMTEGLLASARVEAQILELHLEPVELRGLVRDVVADLRQMHPTRLQLDSHGPAIRLDADPRLLREVLWNLTNNAVRHAGEGATVTLRVRQGDGQAVVAVQDDGAGMEPHVRSRMFEPFRTSAEDGTGLGLAITKHIVELHHGSVLVDTALHRGTIMYLTLPLPSDEVDR